ncbi:MAG: GntR family transcriptional regulator [Hydrogenophaga sp.]|uniref:GntR family transcriptional regulator n=1 Tax=Hydrogenophaga crocea TaxID=2716225 RepID=A0A6G8ICI9_9BURK|nr:MULTISPECIES: GntR family transcriptional regulator [Hydrogenophaga]MBL0945163.1 GntR family transcriptional regulator [Hydrogenophaga sp.]QIM50853.1 GntR family transcriptional regulator [Hydrogenophaga crocea]
MNAALELQRPRLLTDVVGERIREAIVTGDLKLGEQVSEAQLAARMGVSKTPVREALVRLQSQGLVEIHPQRGTFVFTLSPQQLAHLLQFRAMVEIEALREAMATHPQALLQRMAQCVKEMKVAERAKDLPALARIDMSFHHAFFECCDNQYLRASYELLRHQLTALRHRSPISNAVSSHQVLVDAVEDQDPKKAAALLRGHVLENEPRYLQACGKA